jgi:hypothetical protein
MLDAFDVFIGWPFEILNATDSMILVEEGWELRFAGLNVWWMHDCYPNDHFRVDKQQTLCSGTVYEPRIFL